MKNDNSLNRQVVIFIFCVFCFKSAYSQFYVGGKEEKFYAEITPDSAHIESYSGSRYYRIFDQKMSEILLKNERKSDTLYCGKIHQILKTKKGYFLLTRSENNSLSKIPLIRCTSKPRDLERKKAHLGLRNAALNQLVDSLGEFYSSYYRDDYLLDDVNDSLEWNKYKEEIDLLYFKEFERIISSTNPLVTHYYKIANSITETDSVELLTLLDSMDFSSNCEKYFLFQLSQKNPALLIWYLDQEPKNERSVLRAIRHHWKYKQIISSVKAIEPTTKGKRKILKQKSKRYAAYFVRATVTGSIVVSEIALIVLLFAWIF